MWRILRCALCYCFCCCLSKHIYIRNIYIFMCVYFGIIVGRHHFDDDDDDDAQAVRGCFV